MPKNQLKKLKRRASALAEIRAFFAKRHVLEVDTPHLSTCGNPDPHIDSFNCGEYYLNTSPEFYMKRLLSEGSGDIYQLAHVFRAEESGQFHSPEFMMLEWYRVGFSLAELMDEVAALVRLWCADILIERLSYLELFSRFAGVEKLDPIHISRALTKHSIDIPPHLSLDELCDLTLGTIIEPKLKQDHRSLFVYDYPASQASLAKISPHGMASRFELYLNGIEIANGFEELQNSSEQRARFIEQNHSRRAQEKPPIPLDEAFLHALQNGLPACAGVALGVDRLLMCAGQEDHIDAVMHRPD
jgi:elongation factor P--(R)-beta-lysine ligase